MAKNCNLRKASAIKNDEFFTQLTDIEKELGYYKEHFKDKVVFCNCDDPLYSNFWQYFQRNFHFLQLKKLIATHYEAGKNSYKMEIFRTEKGAQMGIPNYVQTPLVGDGDFRSEECVEILKETDIVVTNPPFSLFREYVAQLMEYEKKFIIIGNINCLTYKEIFSLIKGNFLWAGHNEKGGTRRGNTLLFGVSKGYQSKSIIYENGVPFAQVSAWWFTNLDISKRHEELFLYKNYTPEEYPKYDNYDAINVDRTQDIPCDYFGFMGVPITFMDKYNPEQFDILGIMNTGEENKGIRYPNTPHGRPVVNGVEKYLRILIRRKENEN